MPKSKDLEIGGVTKSIKDWASEYGMPTRVIRERIELGWSGTDLLKPTRHLVFHGMSPDGARRPEFTAYMAMRHRCVNPSNKSWHRYGGRGIKVCERWLLGDGARSGFECFFEDMGARPTEQHSLDRIQNDGNYEPGNCRWAPPKVQGENRNSTHWIEWNGRRKHLTDWATELGFSQALLHYRIVIAGWPVEKAFTTPSGVGRSDRHRESIRSNAMMVEWNGERLQIAQWADRTGIPRTTLKNRIKSGWPVEKAMTTPVHEGKSRGGKV